MITTPLFTPKGGESKLLHTAIFWVDFITGWNNTTRSVRTFLPQTVCGVLNRYGRTTAYQGKKSKRWGFRKISIIPRGFCASPANPYSVRITKLLHLRNFVT